MTRKAMSLAIGCSLMLTLLSGCLWAPELDRVRSEIEQQLPGSSFKREFAISLGPVTLGLARAIIRFVPDAAEARSYLQDVRSVKVAVYEAEDMPQDFNIQMPGKLESLLRNDGWEIAARVRENNQSVWVLYREKDDELEDVYVVALESNELVLVRARGNLDSLIAKAMREHVVPAGHAGIPSF